MAREGPWGGQGSPGVTRAGPRGDQDSPRGGQGSVPTPRTHRQRVQRVDQRQGVVPQHIIDVQVGAGRAKSQNC